MAAGARLAPARALSLRKRWNECRDFGDCHSGGSGWAIPSSWDCRWLLAQYFSWPTCTAFATCPYLSAAMTCAHGYMAPQFLPQYCHMMCSSSWRTFRSEEHTSELQSHSDLVCRLLLEKKKEIK